MEEYSYTSTHPRGHNGPVTGKLYLFCGRYVFARMMRGLSVSLERPRGLSEMIYYGKWELRFFWDVQHGADRFSRNVGSELTINAA